MAPMIFNRVRLPVVSMTLSTPVLSRHLMDFKNKQKLAPENGGSQSLLKADQTEKLIQHLSEITDVHTHQIVAYESIR
jgi:hypothetical protein